MPIAIGNRVTEKDIRDWLDGHHYNGGTAVITELDLYAVKRPGWVQVFSFHVKAKPKHETNLLLDENGEDCDDYEDDLSPREYSANDESWKHQFGVVLDDERIRNHQMRTKVWLFDCAETQQQKLDEVSEEMLVRNSKTNPLPLLWIGLTAILFLVIASLVDWLST